MSLPRYRDAVVFEHADDLLPDPTGGDVLEVVSHRAATGIDSVYVGAGFEKEPNCLYGYGAVFDGQLEHGSLVGVVFCFGVSTVPKEELDDVVFSNPRRGSQRREAKVISLLEVGVVGEKPANDGGVAEGRGKGEWCLAVAVDVGVVHVVAVVNEFPDKRKVFLVDCLEEALVALWDGGPRGAQVGDRFRSCGARRRRGGPRRRRGGWPPLGVHWCRVGARGERGGDCLGLKFLRGVDRGRSDFLHERFQIRIVLCPFGLFISHLDPVIPRQKNGQKARRDKITGSDKY